MQRKSCYSENKYPAVETLQAKQPLRKDNLLIQPFLNYGAKVE
ncbi:hypothetical protein HMPREF1981_01963 [Bacteroides pyogenes F0041]|uniref:Uncharacterized protein n=1 Tax=Bacteroides pyogenes F0041 TaxID=1321819 RepID=U2DTW5_9BACE|nr:hypothetical protein HMPREF1981_01963 [Bacteroides pyogenes F0041]